MDHINNLLRRNFDEETARAYMITIEEGAIDLSPTEAGDVDDPRWQYNLMTKAIVEERFQIVDAIFDECDFTHQNYIELYTYGYEHYHYNILAVLSRVMSQELKDRAFYYLCKRGALDLAEVVRNGGANVDAVINEKNPLIKNVMIGNIQALDYLIRVGANRWVLHFNYRLPYFSANLETLRFCVGLYENFDGNNNDNQERLTLINFCAKNRVAFLTPDVINYLLNVLTVDPAIPDFEGITAYARLEELGIPLY